MRIIEWVSLYFNSNNIDKDNKYNNKDKISVSISGYCENENKIAQLEANMDIWCRKRIKSNLQCQREQGVIPSKFTGMEASRTEYIEEKLNLMIQTNLSLKYYANIYAEILDTDNYLKNYLVLTIITQYHMSKGLFI